MKSVNERFDSILGAIERIIDQLNADIILWSGFNQLISVKDRLCLPHVNVPHDSWSEFLNHVKPTVPSG